MPAVHVCLDNADLLRSHPHCLLQAVKGFHAKGRGVSDLQPDNLMVQVLANGSFQDCTVLDVGGSAVFSGQCSTSGPCLYALLCVPSCRTTHAAHACALMWHVCGVGDC